jgi:hypothetical protein
MMAIIYAACAPRRRGLCRRSLSSMVSDDSLRRSPIDVVDDVRICHQGA